MPKYGIKCSNGGQVSLVSLGLLVLIGWEHPSKILMGGAICDAGFAGYCTLITWGLAAASVASARTIALVGLVGASVCSLSPK